MQNNNLYENENHSTPQKPYSLLSGSIPNWFQHVPSHCHKEYEINYVVRGDGIYNINSTCINAQEGDIIIIPPKAAHSIFPAEHSQHTFHSFLFSAEFLGNFQERSALEYFLPVSINKKCFKSPIHKEDPGHERLTALYKDIHTLVISDTAQADILIKSRLLEFFWLLLNNGYLIDQEPTMMHTSDMEALRAVIEYINKNYHQNILVSDLAAIACRSEGSFMRLFYNTVGMTAIEFVTQIRIQQACTLLHSTDKSILEISIDCGYQNLSNFNRLFKRITRNTPREYRNISYA